MIRRWLRMLGPLALVGCGGLTLEKIATPEDRAVARGYLEAVRHKDFEAVERDADESLRGPDLRSSLEKLASLFPAGEPRSEELVGAHRNLSPAGTTVSTTFELEYEGSWVLASAVVRERDGVRSILGLQVVPQEQSLAELHRFTFRGKGVGHYLVLLAVAAALGVTLVALVLVVRTEVPGRKWLWIVFILFGVGQFTLNWTTGQWGLKLVAVQLLSAGYFRPWSGPWLIHVALPLGAIVFLLRRRQWTGTPLEDPGYEPWREKESVESGGLEAARSGVLPASTTKESGELNAADDEGRGL